jgi:transposase
MPSHPWVAQPDTLQLRAVRQGAILYTIVESCRRRGIDPYAYLRDVLTRLPNSTNWQIKDLTPEAWAKARNTRDFKAAA